MNARHLQGEEQERAQKAQVVRLPETFADPDGAYTQAYRSASFAIYLRSEPAHSQNQHKFFAWKIRVVGNVEMLGDPITESASLDACINLAAKWEAQQ
jgi:hypothetical protein